MKIEDFPPSLCTDLQCATLFLPLNPPAQLLHQTPLPVLLRWSEFVALLFVVVV